MAHKFLEAATPVYCSLMSACLVCDPVQAATIGTPLAKRNTGLERIGRGHKGFFIVECPFTFTDITDIEEWEEGILGDGTKADIHFIYDCSINGGSEESFETLQEGCDLSESYEDFVETFTINIYKDTPTFARWELLKRLRGSKYKGTFYIGFVTCDDKILVSTEGGLLTPISFNATKAIGADKSQTSQYTVTVSVDSDKIKRLATTWTAKDLPKEPTITP
jgi:hypothetical protein